MVLSAEQIILIGMLASVLSQVVKYLAAKSDKVMSRPMLTVVVFAISVALGAFWMTPVVATSGDPLAVTKSILEAASMVFGFATLIYNLLLSKLFEMLGM